MVTPLVAPVAVTSYWPGANVGTTKVTAAVPFVSTVAVPTAQSFLRAGVKALPFDLASIDRIAILPDQTGNLRTIDPSMLAK